MRCCRWTSCAGRSQGRCGWMHSRLTPHFSCLGLACHTLPLYPPLEHRTDVVRSTVRGRPKSGPRKDDDSRAPPPERAQDCPAARRDERAGPAGRFVVRPHRRGDRVRRRAGHERLRLLQLRQDRAAGHARAPGLRARGARPVPDRARARAHRAPAHAAALHQPDGRAERLRHRPQPAPRRRLRHHRPARAPRRARAARRPRARAQPRLQPRHPHLVGRGRARQP